VDPLTQSSPCFPGGKASPVSASTIFASQQAVSLPTEPQWRLSSGLFDRDRTPVDSVSP